VNTPMISVIIATYNSSDRVPKLKETLDRQVDEHGEPWGDRLQVLCVDGGSTDATRELALEAQWSVLDNPAGDPVSAKVIGWNAAKSDLVCVLDHDEVLINTDSLARKLDALISNPTIVAVFSSGYYVEDLRSPDAYLSEFGDAFSSFAYRSRNNSSAMNRLGRVTPEQTSLNLRIYNTPKPRNRVLLEIAAQGVLTSKGRLAQSLGQASSTGEVLLRGAGLTFLAESAQVALLNNDPIGHDPRASWSSIRAKGRWRLHNNLRITKASGGAFRSREGRQTTILVAFLYALHVVTVLPLVARATVISVRSRKNYFLGHVFLSFALLFDALAVLLRPEQGRYGS
jgi:glycosyltransferase involved in cell wall biosynthesis